MFLIVFSLFFSLNLFAQTFNEGEYYNYSISKKLKKKLIKYDNIEFNLYNPTNEKKEFYLVFEDNRSNDYWSKLNFKTTIIPGENHLSFNLKRYVGERGSIRHARGINYKKLKKMFMVINPDQNKNIKYKITNLKYTNNLQVKLPKGAFAYNFQKSSLKTLALKIFTNTTEKSLYKKRKGFGFEKIDVWQFRNSHIAPHYLSHSISVKKAIFKIKAPKGKYKIRMIWDELGYWDIPFWKKRSMVINGVRFSPKVRGVSEFLNKLFSFKDEPLITSHPFDYFFKKIFENYDQTINNKGHYLEFKFEGDVSAVALNALFVWPIEKDKQMNIFFDQLKKYSKNKMDQKYRYIKNKKDKRVKLSLAKVDISKEFLPQNLCNNKNPFENTFSNNGQKNIDLCISSNSKRPVNISFTNFTNGKYKIDSSAFTIKKYQYQFKSIDLNHETYQLEANRLMKSTSTIKFDKYRTRYISISFFGGAYKAGKYVGNIILKQGKNILKRKMTINILNTKYPILPVSAGVIGLNPFPQTYFKDVRLNNLREASYFGALKLLQEIGLSLYTDIPAPFVSYKKPSYESFELNTNKSLNFLNKSKSKNVFFYNGDFSKKFFNDDQRNISQSQSVYYANMRSELEKFQKKSKKKMIYLYSDEATGYRNAVNSDLRLIKLYHNRFPSLLFGGFGNLYDWDKGKELYKAWNFGLYSDIPSQQLFKKVKRYNKEFGVYNLCADSQYDLSFCFGIQLYRLYKANIKYYFEWHAAAIHNYPYMDLDGREADIGIFYPTKTGDVGITKRYRQVSDGLEIFKKLLLLEKYLINIKAPGQKVHKARRWLKNLLRAQLFPIKRYYDQNYRNNSKLTFQLDQYLQMFFI